jgi:hypothetical protein
VSARNRPALLAALLALVALLGCASSSAPGIKSYLDEKTAVTVRATTTPWVLAHELPELSANSRDYLDLRVLEVDRMGDRLAFLSVVAWSTVDRWVGAGTPALGPLALRLDAETIELTPAPADGEVAGLSQRLFARRHGQQAAAEYRVTPELIARMVRAGSVSVALTGSEAPVYEAWAPARSAFAAFAGEPQLAGRR